MLDFGFYNMDCMIGMKEFPDGFFDLAIVDPPYGINVGQMNMGACGGVAPDSNRSAKNYMPFGGKNSGGGRPMQIGGANPFGGRNSSRGRVFYDPKIYKAFDDSHTPDAAYFKELKRVAKNMIIFGGNYFLDHLGATECLIVWDKKRRGLNFADCEIAWTNIKQPCRIFEWKWNGMLQEDMKNKEYRIHPTQKPVALYKWLLECYMPEGGVHVGHACRVSVIPCRVSRTRVQVCRV